MKQPRFTIRRRGDRKSWTLEVAPGFSPTGRRQQRSFSSKEAALEAQRELKKQAKARGLSAASTSLDPLTTADCLKAQEILAPTGATLTAAAQFYAQHHDQRGRSVTFEEACAEFERARETKSEVYQRKIQSTVRKFTPVFEGRLICDITKEEARKAIMAGSSAPSRLEEFKRHLSVLWKMAVDCGWASENVVSSVKLPEVVKG